ncbi:MAG: hypothetical protein ACM3XS_06875, partial [Bacteroidota bacterium]
LEDLEAAMVAAKNKCQTESGKPVIPMGLNPNGITAQIMEAAFGLKTRGPLGYDDKKGPSFKFHDERAWQALRWLNRWWRMGLIDQEGFTQTEEQWRAKTHNGDILFCLGGAYYDMPSWGGMLDKKTAKYYAMAEPVAATFKGEYKNTPFAPWPGGWVGITKNCKNVDLALKYLDWVGSARGQLITHYGYDPKGKLDYLQGKLWEWVPGQKGKKLQFTAEHEKERTADIPSALNKYGYFYTTTLYNGDVISPYEWWADAEPIKEMSKKWCWDASLIRNIIPTPGSPEAIIDTNITDLTTREVPRIVMAESEAESQKIYKAMVEAMDKAGAAKLEAWWQQMWKANKAKLNR